MKIDPNHALVVFSGGQDSTTCLGYALANYAKVTCLTFDYGQKHAREIEAGHNVIRHFEKNLQVYIDREIVSLGSEIFRGTSPLLQGGDQLETYTSYDEMEAIIGDRVEKTFVPMRNAVFLQLAANRAVCCGAGVIITGVCDADNANYPDCRETFICATQLAINEALGFSPPDPMAEEFDQLATPYIRIDTPLINLSKAQSIVMALTLPHTYTALAFSHTAYDGSYPPNGGDHASVLRAHGFAQAGVPDPLILRAFREGLLGNDDLPKTSNYDSTRLVLNLA